MVSATETPNLIPITPEWLQRNKTRSPNTNRNIHDIYWKRSQRESSPGYIITGPSAVLMANGRPVTAQAERWIRNGRIPLIEYSYTDQVSPLTGARETLEPVNAQNRMGRGYRYYWLFVNGGAHLFPVEQIVEHHWHITPPYGLSLDVFPQLREWEVPRPYWCGACASPEIPYNSDEQLVKHIVRNHGLTLQAAREYMRTYDLHTRPLSANGIVMRRRVQEEPETEDSGIEESVVANRARARG